MLHDFIQTPYCCSSSQGPNKWCERCINKGEIVSILEMVYVLHMQIFSTQEEHNGHNFFI